MSSESPKKGRKTKASKRRGGSEPTLSPLAQQIQAYVCARFPILYLVTWEEERALREIEQVAIAQRKMCFVWSETEGARNIVLPAEREDRRAAEPAAILGRILREANDSKNTKGAIYVLRDLHPYLDQNRIRRLVRDLARDLLTSAKTVIILAPRLKLPHELQKAITVVDVPLPSRPELEGHLAAILERSKAPPLQRLDARDRDGLIRSAQGMTLREFEQTLALAVAVDAATPRAIIDLVLQEKEQVVRKSTVLECVRWAAGFEDVGGLDGLKAFLTSRRDAFAAEARSFGLPAPRGLCLIGVQGCGKSLSAKAVAQFYRIPLVRFDVGRVFAGLVGQSEENVRGALKLAESLAPCVLWIDELEKSLSGAGSSNNTDGGTTARVISTITTWLQERDQDQGVYVVATANDISRLPPELLRKGRFDEIFFVDLPEPTEREAILAIHLKKRDRDPQDFDLTQVAAATDGFSGAELEEVVIAGMYEAFADGPRPLATPDLLYAVQQTVPLSATMKERVSELRSWAKGRARPATLPA